MTTARTHNINVIPILPKNIVWDILKGINASFLAHFYEHTLERTVYTEPQALCFSEMIAMAK